MRFQQRVDATRLWNESGIRRSWYGGASSSPPPPPPPRPAPGCLHSLWGKALQESGRSSCSCMGQGRGYLGVGAPVLVDHDTVTLCGWGAGGPVVQPRGGWPGS